jgi:hypothetical protein
MGSSNSFLRMKGEGEGVAPEGTVFAGEENSISGQMFAVETSTKERVM